MGLAFDNVAIVNLIPVVRGWLLEVVLRDLRLSVTWGGCEDCQLNGRSCFWCSLFGALSWASRLS